MADIATEAPVNDIVEQPTAGGDAPNGDAKPAADADAGDAKPVDAGNGDAAAVGDADNGKENADEEMKELSVRPELEKKIIRQIEYYFGDVNLAKDKFMKEIIAQNDGWIDMSTMLKFNRLAAMCDDQDLILKAMGNSTSGLIEIDTEKKRIRRDPFKPLPTFTKEVAEEINSRTLYIKGFPVECTLDDLNEWFDERGGADRVGIRRLKDAFKGSVFVTMKSKESAEKLLTAEDLTFKEKKLEKCCTRQAYWDKKSEDKKGRDEEEAKV